MEMLNTRPRAVIFDLDGTLIDSLAWTFQAMREAVAPELGRDLTDEEIYARFGPADHQIVADLVGPEARTETVARLMSAYERGLARMPLFDGVRALLAGLEERGLLLGLCTGRGRPSTDILLASHGLVDGFGASVTGEEVPWPKPAPDGILETTRRLGVRPGEAIYVGDSVKDVEAGLAAGTTTVAALWGGVEGEAPGFAAAHLRARRPAELLAFVERLLAL